MAAREREAHPARMAEIIVLVCTALVFLALVAAVPIELSEARRDEREVRTHR